MPGKRLMAAPGDEIRDLPAFRIAARPLESFDPWDDSDGGGAWTVEAMMHNAEFDTREELSSGLVLTAAQLNVGGVSYPPYNQVLILAGGPGSGKGFQLGNLVNMTGKHYDVDELKTAVAKLKSIKERIQPAFLAAARKYGRDDAEAAALLAKLGTPGALSDPDFTKTLHEAIKRYERPSPALSDAGIKNGLDDRATYTLLVTLKNELAKNPAALDFAGRRRPNLIFDTTLKSLAKLREISTLCQAAGYKPENIHIVWVLQRLEMALANNKSRGRQVPEEIAAEIHESVARTMGAVFAMGKGLAQYINGDIWVSFGTHGVKAELPDPPAGVSADRLVYQRDKDGKEIRDKEHFVGILVDTARGKKVLHCGPNDIESITHKLGDGKKFVEVLHGNYFCLKRAGQPVQPPAALSKEIADKILDYAPDFARPARI